MRIKILALALLGLTGAAGASELSGLQTTLDGFQQTGSGWTALYDGGIEGKPKGGAVAAAATPAAAPAKSSLSVEARPALKAVPPPAASRAEGGVWTGVKKGAGEGALLGFFGVLSPAVALLSKGMDAGFGRNVDAYRAYTAAGVVLGAILYIPALAIGAAGGAIGAVAGAVSEAVKPGSTKKWDAERIFG